MLDLQGELSFIYIFGVLFGLPVWKAPASIHFSNNLEGACRFDLVL